MKYYVITILAGLTVFSCKHVAVSETESTDTTEAARSLYPKYRSTVSLKGNVTSVSPRLISSSSAVTLVQLSIPYQCYQSFANMNYELIEGTEKKQLLVSAEYYQGKQQPCTAVLREDAVTIQLTGFYKEDDLEILWLESNEVKLKRGDLAVHPIESAEITDVKLMCPPDPNGGPTCTAFGSIATVSLHLDGCRDRLGSVTSHTVVKENGKADLYVHALNIATKNSTVSHCVALPLASHAFNIPINIEKKNDVRLFMINEK